MEKTGRIVLTKQELDGFLASGEVPLRVKDDWSLSKTELSSLVTAGQVEVIQGSCKSCSNCNQQRENKDD